MTNLPDIIESISILATYQKHVEFYVGNSDVVKALTEMVAEMLNVSEDKLLELCEEEAKVIAIINDN